VPPAGGADGPALLHLHGGGFVLGSAQSSVALAARIAAAVGGWALVPDYRLAPEHPFPAALEDVHTAYRWLLEQGPRAIAFSGECAGGALAVSLGVRLRDERTELPLAIHAVSPFADLTVSSATASARSDPWFNRDVLRLYAASYLHDADPLSPLVSAVHADLRGLPPLLIEVAADEALLDDAVALARAAEEAGVDVSLRTVADSGPLVRPLRLLAGGRRSARGFRSARRRRVSSRPLGRVGRQLRVVDDMDLPGDDPRDQPLLERDQLLRERRPAGRPPHLGSTSYGAYAPPLATLAATRAATARPTTANGTSTTRPLRTRNLRRRR
jgi:acetyl esterase/lipase